MQNSPARSSIDVGSVIAGTYTIEALIGRGGMGAVFLASHTRLPGKKVAIKVLHAEMEGDEIMARFKREAQIASLLSHPNIVHIEDYNVTADGMPYLVLEYLQGESLAQRLRRGPLPTEQVFSIIRQVGSALAVAHDKGIVHRDLKPQNIFLVPTELDGRAIEIAKVLDFGISKMRDSQTVKTQESALLGTPQYMAPEQATGQHDRVDARTDIFALGAIVYEMLSGHPAFGGQSIPEVVFKVVYEQPIALETRVPGVSDTVRTAVQRALAKPAQERFDSVNGFISALTGSPVSVMRSGPLPLPDVGFAAGSAATGTAPAPFDAFGQTVSSGEHGVSPLSDTMPSTRSGVAPPSLPSVARDAPTVASHAGTGATPAPASSSSKRGLVIGLSVVAAAAAAAGIMYTVMREPAPAPAPAPPPAVAQVQPPLQPSPTTPTTPTTTTTTTTTNTLPPPAATQAVAEPPATVLDAGVPAAPTTTTPGGTTPTTPPTRPPPRGSAPPETSDDGGEPADPSNRASQKLLEAQRALAERAFEKAETAANAVIGAEDARPKQRGQAYLIHGAVQCEFRNNEDTAGADLRFLGARFPALHDQLLQRCQKAGYLVGRPFLGRKR